MATLFSRARQPRCRRIRASGRSISAMPDAAVAPVADASEVLRVQDLVVSYGAVAALRGVSLHVDRGEVGALLGAKCAGNSTMLRTIPGLLLPTSGDIRLLG